MTQDKQTETVREYNPVELGEVLRQAREQKNLSVGEVSERLKLPARQIEALENGEYESLPEPVFVRGFLRSYGRFLDIDEAILVAALAHISPPAKVHHAKHRDGELNFANERVKKSFPTWIFGVLAVIAIGYGVYAWQGKSQAEHAKQEAETSPIAASGVRKVDLDNPNVAVKPMDASDTQTATASGAASGAAGELVINARYRTMLTVTNARGEVLINEIVPARSEHRFQNGAPFEVKLGYASGSTATFDGQAIDVNAARHGSKTAVFTAGK